MSANWKVVERKDGKTSRMVSIRLLDDEIAFLEMLEEHQGPKVKRRGVGPAVHRLIELAREWERVYAGPLRAYLGENGMTVEEFAERAGLEEGTVRDILTLQTRLPAMETKARIRGVIGEGA
jgi:hypothetical protein